VSSSKKYITALIELNIYDQHVYISVQTYSLDMNQIVSLNDKTHGESWLVESHARICHSICNWLQNVFATAWYDYNTKEFYRETEEFLRTKFTTTPDYYYVYADPRLLSQVSDLYLVRYDHLPKQTVIPMLEAVLSRVVTSHARKMS